MIRLLLDDKPAVVKEGASFKFVIENQAFSDQGSYSLEIPLPLQGCAENRLIFGIAHRIEVSQRKYDGKFSLSTDKVTMGGEYKIVEINEEEVKIQLLANKTLASYNSKDERGQKLFIDQIPLGDMLDECDLAQEIYDMGVPEIDPDFKEHPNNLRDLAFYFDTAGKWRMHAESGRTTCVVFPIGATSSQDTQIANIHEVNDLGEYVLKTRYPGVNVINYNEKIALQPTILEVLRRIYQFLGFGFKSELGALARNTFIANSRCTLHYADILPHWTINEFITEVCNFFNGVVIIEDGMATLKRRNFYFDVAPQKIDNVLDEYIIQCEEDSAEGNSSTGNVDYEWPAEDPLIRLPEDVWEQAEIVEFPNKTKLDIFVGNLKAEEKAQSRYVLIDNSTGYRYALLQNDSTPDADFELKQVDWYQPLIRNKENRDIQTSLRIVPVRMQTLNMEFITDITIMTVEDVIQSDTVFSVNNTIKPSSESAQNENIVDKRDVIEVFCHNGYSEVDTKFKGRVASPTGVMIQTDDTTGFAEPITFYDYSSVNKLGPYLLEERFTGNNVKSIETRQQYQIKFLTNKMLDINSPFLIKNKKFICKKLEYTCDTNGTSKLVTGTFYAI